jgi:esterase/lipase
MNEYPVESILSARQVVNARISGDYIYFISDMSGMMSLYRMRKVGSFPERLIPADMALQNPHLMAGQLFVIFPSLGKIMVMADENGNELYQPNFIPLEGGVPERIFGDNYLGQQIACTFYDTKKSIAYFRRDDRTITDKAIQYSMMVNLKSMEVKVLGVNQRGFGPIPNRNHSRVILNELYITGDRVTYLWESGVDGLKTVLGTPLAERSEGEEIRLYNISPVHWLTDGLLCYTTEFDDLGGLAFMTLSNPQDYKPVKIEGTKHTGIGQFSGFRHIEGTRFLIAYNIDGVSWYYETELDETQLIMTVKHVIVGHPPLNDGVALSVYWDESLKISDDTPIEYIISFTSATQPSQLYLNTPAHDNQPIVKLTNERILGIPQELFSRGEDANYTSYDGLRISSRLYLPSSKLGFEGPRPLVLYVHGGPQSQERPDFTWFSMPLIQLLTLNGFAVLVPNVRGSSGYGFKYTKQVDHDWGGKDRLDLVEGLKYLENDPRIDSTRRAVVGRSYGGYMTLTLATRHSDLWQAACDMFGPYNLISFIERLPESWAAYFYLSIGHPEKDADFLRERSPSTYFNQLKAPMLIIQGKNDPRVVEQESKDIVDRLNADGKHVEYLMFEDEGHDVLKFKNKVTVYNRIVEFFKEHLNP